MKEKICGVLSYPYPDKYVISVHRQLDRFHQPTARIYSARYTEPEGVRRLCELFLKINSGLQRRLIDAKIIVWSSQKGVI